VSTDEPAIPPAESTPNKASTKSARVRLHRRQDSLSLPALRRSQVSTFAFADPGKRNEKFFFTGAGTTVVGTGIGDPK
jgi:hypothetical protein